LTPRCPCSIPQPGLDVPAEAVSPRA
jgi:hypothetical protein